MKRIFSFLLAFLIVAGTLPMTDLSVYATYAEETSPVEDIQTTEGTTPSDAPSEPAEKSETLSAEELEPPTTYSGTCGDDLT